MLDRLKIIGSSHIAKDSVNMVKQEIKEFSPDIVAIELDKRRIVSLFSKNQKPNYLAMMRLVGIKGLLFSLIGSYAQKKLGKIVGVSPGAEMKTAVTEAKKNNLQIALIDQDIEITLRKFSKALSWREKWNFVVDILNALVGVRPKLMFDIRTVPDDKVIDVLISQVKGRYPNVYDVLIEQRNQIMAKRLFNILKNNPTSKILAVVGAGHKSEMIQLLKKYEKEN